MKVSRVGHLLALVPTIGVGLALQAKTESLWGIVIAYHLFCVATPLALKLPRIRATPALRNTLVQSVVVSLALVMIGFSIHYSEVSNVLASFAAPLMNMIRPANAFLLYSLLVNPFCEEWLWRGCLVDLIGPRKSAGYFALTHFVALAHFFPIVQSFLLALPVFATALYWEYLRLRSGSLWPSIITHLSVDAAILLCLGIPSLG